MALDPYVRNKYTRTLDDARRLARDYFQKYPKDLYRTEVERWSNIQSNNIEFVMRRLREPLT